MVGVAALITDEDGRLLLLNRTDNHCWGPPGGSTEPGERIDEALRREVFEETGLMLGKLALYNVYSGPEFDYTYPNGDKVYNVTVIYTATTVQGSEIRLNYEHSAWAWYSLFALPADISPPMAPILLEYQNNFRGA